MSTIRIVLDIPEHILQGLENGSYVRDAAGVIRWASGTEKAGEIVCHLKEIGEYQLAGELLVPMGVMLATQLAGFLFLGYKLDKIQNAIEGLKSELRRVKNIVELIHLEIWLSKLKRVHHGIEHLVDGSIKDAQKAFREGRSDIGYFLHHQQPSMLVAYLPQTEELLKGLCISFAGEYICMQSKKSRLAKSNSMFQRYCEIFEATKQKLDQFPSINKVLPNSAQLENFRAIEPLKNKITNTNQWILSEEEFAKAIRTVDNEDAKRLVNEDIMRDSNRKIILELY